MTNTDEIERSARLIEKYVFDCVTRKRL